MEEKVQAQQATSSGEEKDGGDGGGRRRWAAASRKATIRVTVVYSCLKSAVRRLARPYPRLSCLHQHNPLSLELVIIDSTIG